MKYVKISAYDTVRGITRKEDEEIIRRVEIDLTLPNQYEEYLMNMSGYQFGVELEKYITFRFYRFVFHQKRTWYDNPLQALYNFHTGLDLVNFDFQIGEKVRIFEGAKIIKAWENWNMPLPSMNKFLEDFIESVDRKFYSQTYSKGLKELLGCIKQNALNTTPETLY